MDLLQNEHFEFYPEEDWDMEEEIDSHVQNVLSISKNG